MRIFNGKEVFTTIEELVDPKHTALILIDIQNDYITRGGAWGEMGMDFILGQFVPNNKKILESARKNGVMVAHVQFTVHSDSRAESPAWLRSRLIRSVDGELTPYCIENTWGWQIIDELAPLPGETVIRKHRPSAFLGTNLDMILRSNNIKSAVIVGLVTHGCVLATAIDAQGRGYCTVVIQDCVVSHQSPLHDAALLVMSSDKDVTDSESVLKVWENKPFSR